MEAHALQQLVQSVPHLFAPDITEAQIEQLAVLVAERQTTKFGEEVVYKGMSLAGLIEGYEICDRENTNLRKHLLWAAEHLPAATRRELRSRLDPSIEDGGIVNTMDDDARVALVDYLQAVGHVVQLCEQAVNTNGAIGDGWFAQVDFRLANVRQTQQQLVETQSAVFGELGEESPLVPFTPVRTKTPGLAEAVQERRDVELDAARWRALITTPYIRVQGWAGFLPARSTDTTPGGERNPLVPNPDGYMHFGIEFTSQVRPGGKDIITRETTTGRGILIAYADKMIDMKMKGTPS